MSSRIQRDSGLKIKSPTYVFTVYSSQANKTIWVPTSLEKSPFSTIMSPSKNDKSFLRTYLFCHEQTVIYTVCCENIVSSKGTPSVADFDETFRPGRRPCRRRGVPLCSAPVALPRHRDRFDSPPITIIIIMTKRRRRRAHIKQYLRKRFRTDFTS